MSVHPQAPLKKTIFTLVEYILSNLISSYEKNTKNSKLIPYIKRYCLFPIVSTKNKKKQ